MSDKRHHAYAVVRTSQQIHAAQGLCQFETLIVTQNCIFITGVQQRHHNSK